MHDPITGDVIIVAPGRRYRPQTTVLRKKHDPFSPNNLKTQRVLDTYGKGLHRITVIKNLYPVFHHNRSVEGRQEILVEGTRVEPFSTFSVSRIHEVLDVMEDRCRIFRKDPQLKFMVVFKNEGKDAGGSQPHPHSQIFGLPFVPDRIRFMARARRALQKRSRMSAHALALCEATKARIIYADRNVIAFADPVSRFSYGVRIVPRRSVDNLTKTTKHERLSLAAALHVLFPLIRERKVPFNFYFHDAFGQTDECFEIRFAPRINIWGGFELDAGVVVNPVPAECAAAEYLAAR